MKRAKLMLLTLMILLAVTVTPASAITDGKLTALTTLRSS